MTNFDPTFTWDDLTYIALDEDLAPGQRWSTWTSVDRTLARGPEPWPSWLVTSQAPLDTELGVLKAGKAADAPVLDRAVPDDAGVPVAGAACLLAAKRYRSTQHRLFHRDTGYTEGRRTRKSRDARAKAKNTAYGRAVEAVEWAAAEFATLKALCVAGSSAPYPGQIAGSETLVELIMGGAAAAPRLVQTRPAPEILPDLYEQLRTSLGIMARLGLAHGDLSPFNVLLADEGTRLVLIDVPQVVDIVGNPHGVDLLHRDCTTMARWFTSRGLAADGDELLADLPGQAF